ncbi:STAS domain-containing protein [Streptomyces rimosus]
MATPAEGGKKHVVSAYDLRMTYFKRHGHTVLVLDGELDPYNWPDFRAVLSSLTSEGDGSLIVVVEPQTYLDATNLGALVGAMKSLRETNPTRTVHVVTGEPNSYLNRLLRTAGLTRVFPLHETLDDALAMLSGHRAES